MDSAKESSPTNFAKKMFEGKTKDALRLLTNQDQGRPVRLEDTVLSSNGESLAVLDVLRNKHPHGEPVYESAVLQGPTDTENVHPVLFDNVDSTLIQSVVLATNGAVGPSGMDARGWRRICTSFKGASSDLCHSLALLAHCLATTYVDPAGLAPFFGMSSLSP